MDQAITLGNILAFVGIIGGIFLVIELVFGPLFLMNPFR